jgi:MarR family transcriptional regulator for hemolysin
MSTKSATDSLPSVRLGRTVTRIFRLWRRQVELSLEDLDLTDATRMPLIVLFDHGRAMQQKEIAAAMAVDTSSLVRVLKLLSEKGLIACGADPLDGRAKAIALTPVGEDYAKGLIQRSLAIENAALAIYSPQERAQLRELLNRLSTHLEQGPL